MSEVESVRQQDESDSSVREGEANTIVTPRPYDGDVHNNEEVSEHDADVHFYLATKKRVDDLEHLQEDDEEEELQNTLLLQQRQIKEDDEDEEERIRDEFGLNMDRTVMEDYLRFKNEKLELQCFDLENKWKEKGITTHNIEQLLIDREDEQKQAEEESTTTTQQDDQKEEKEQPSNRTNRRSSFERTTGKNRSSSNSSVALMTEQMYELIYEHGIPNSLRSKVWYWLTRAEEKERSAKIGYWSSLVKTKTNVTKAIEKDVTRTFPGHPFFDSPSGQHSLLRILTAYSVINPTLGYCQSMNFICGTILLIESYDEEKTFWMLVSLIDSLLQPKSQLTKSMLCFVETTNNRIILESQ
eukprot:TRINITY_DN1513_c0_g4_i1.p1 TRINITY_DN1513_c0_g4~~TRINITY_DN1513_c0_g4_i1.p1  ORF type:complete len:356 (-),score=109.26 TRINITY_DN1513_c0_g4_i1:605-1672(-)